MSYLHHLETSEVKVKEVDFEALKAEPSSHTPAVASKSVTKEKEEALIDGAVQIAIGVKKEVDFAGWYTNVSLLQIIYVLSNFDIQVLLKADMIDYYSVSGCYILKPWSYSIWEEIQRQSYSLFLLLMLILLIRLV